MFRIRIHLIQIRIQHFRLNTDPDPNTDPGFWGPKIEKNLQLKKNYGIFLNQKLQYTYSQASIKDVQATEEAFSPEKRASSTSKHLPGSG